jgi:hypothetical protein
VFAVLMLLAWFLNSAETPEYGAPDHDWTNWAKDSEMKQRFAAFFALLAGLVFLPFAATIRDVLANAEEPAVRQVGAPGARRLRWWPDRHHGHRDGYRHDHRCECPRCRRGSCGE